MMYGIPEQEKSRKEYLLRKEQIVHFQILPGRDVVILMSDGDVYIRRRYSKQWELLDWQEELIQSVVYGDTESNT